MEDGSTGYLQTMHVATRYLRFMARCAWVCVLAWTGSLRRAKRHLRESGSIVTLTFHRVLDDAARQSTNSLPGIIIRERTFQELIRYLAGCCELVDFSDAKPGVAVGKVRLALTFDDGWSDNFSTAFPILCAYNVPAEIFVCPQVVDTVMPFWPERASLLLRAARPDITDRQIAEQVESLKRLGPAEREQSMERWRLEPQKQRSGDNALDVDRTLSWDQIMEMDQAGICFGSHTDSHQILTTIPPDLVREEVEHSKATLERTLGKTCRVFAYPNGDWSPETREMVAQAGFTRAAVTTSGVWTSASDPLALPRSNVSESDAVGISGRFWPAMFEYTTLWKAYRAATRTVRSVSVYPNAARPSSVTKSDLSNSPDLSKA